ncbi:hypothetical protein AB6884_04610 [Carnobacterium maltaromaticum]|uniref:hypothetical protein n=1 Tax=Carnobacterium maltaromaticum TaxID=2751 RepID=UPI0039BDC15E
MLEAIANIIDGLVAMVILVLTSCAVWQGYTLKIGNWFKSSQLPLKDYFKKGDKKNDK